jgi:hypothetical protein
MIARSHVWMAASPLQKTAWVVFWAVAIAIPSALGEGTNARVTVWDTGSPLSGTAGLRNRAGWKTVPPDLLTLEADPPKASSDPGYYGREYAFAGDAVVENDFVTVAFASSEGMVTIYSRTDPSGEVLGFVPLQTKTKQMSIRRCAILQNTGDEVALEVFFSAGSAGEDVSAIFSFDRTQIIEIRPSGKMEGVSLVGAMEYGVVPSFIGDDLIFSPKAYPSATTLSVPSENLFLGLLKGESRVLVMTWPKGQQQMQLALSDEGQDSRFIDAIDFENDGQSIYLALLEAPGIWHKEELKLSYLEKDVTSSWKRPFPAKWVTQLDEAGVKATFALRESKGQIWRGVPGMYAYPVWFDGDNAVYHLSKKVLPRGESIVYFLEGQDTPVPVSTPVDILKATLGRPMCESILDVSGRKLRTHHRRGAEGIRRACTCGCTEAIETVFKAGEEVERSQYVEGAVGDMVYFVRVHLERLDEYRAFAKDLIDFCHTSGSSSPQLKPFLDQMEQIVQQIPQDYEVQKANIKSLDYANQLARQTVALTRKKDAGSLPACLALGNEWRGMGGAQDGLLAQYHITTRDLFQQAGYGCATVPEAVAVAQEIRRRCKQCLRNADGYEIWPGY